MIEQALRRLVDHPRRLWIVITVSFLIGLVTVFPLVDEYSDLKGKQRQLTASLKTAQSAAAHLKKFEQQVRRQLAELENIEKKAISEKEIHAYRGNIVRLVRESGCRVRRINVGKRQMRAWMQEDDPLEKQAKKKGNKETEYDLQFQPFHMSISGTLPRVKQLLAALHAEGTLAHTVSISLRPDGSKRKEVILELKLRLFDLDRKKKVSA